MEAFMPIRTAAEALLTRLRDGWRARQEFANVSQGELDLIAGEFGMTAKDLLMVVERGPDAANLLYERMRALGVSEQDVERAADGLMRDLEKTCACCNNRSACKKDLARRPHDPKWESYCPNALELEALSKLKGHL
jgi:hypothetical protein